MVKTAQKRPRPPGRPRTGKGIGVQVRFPQAELDDLDGWIRRDGGLLTRPQAIRRLVRIALGQKKK